MALKKIPPIGFQEPNRKKSYYKEVCQSKYAYIFHFVEIEIRFWKSTLHNYKKAVYVCSLFPQNEITIESNYLWIASEEEFCIYFDALYELFMSSLC